MNEKHLLYSIGPTTALTALGVALHEHYGEGVAMAPGGLALATMWVAGNTKSPAIWGMVGALSYGAVVSWFGFDPATLYSWAAASAGAFAARLLFEHKNRHTHLDEQYKVARAETGFARARLAALQLERQSSPLALEGPAGPRLTGHTPEETAIREAVYELYKVELPGVQMEYDRWGWKATISTPPTLPRVRLKTEWETKMENALALEGVTRLWFGTAGNQLIVRYLAEDPLEDVVDYVSEDLENVSAPLYLGPDETAERTLVKLLGRHVLILGTSGNGKSTLMQLLILRLFSAGAACIGIDMKRGVELEPVRPLLQTLATNPEESREVFEWIDQEVDRRSELMKARGVRKWSEDLGPYIWVFVDELSELTAKVNNKGLDKDDPTLAEMLDQRLRIDRAFGIHFVAATQAPSKNAFGGSTDQRTNYKIRIATRLEEAAHAQFGYGQNWKKEGWDPNGLLQGPGEYLIRSEDPGFRRPVRRKFMMITDEDIDAEVYRLLPRKTEIAGSPWGEGGARLSPRQLVERFMRGRGDLTRAQIEEGTGLEKKQVLNALMNLGAEVVRDPVRHTYRMASEGPGGVAQPGAVSE